MAFTLSLNTSHLTLAVGDCDENLRIGPLEVYLKWHMQAISWRGRFELTCEEGFGVMKLDGKWFVALEGTGERRCWFCMGRYISLNTKSAAARTSSDDLQSDIGE